MLLTRKRRTGLLFGGVLVFSAACGHERYYGGGRRDELPDVERPAAAGAAPNLGPSEQGGAPDPGSDLPLAGAGAGGGG